MVPAVSMPDLTRFSHLPPGPGVQRRFIPRPGLIRYANRCRSSDSLRISPHMVETIEWTPRGVVMIDQTRLPLHEEYVTCRNYQEVATAIRDMIIRGAPAIGVAAAMGVAIGVQYASEVDLDGQVDAIRSEEHTSELQ